MVRWFNTKMSRLNQFFYHYYITIINSYLTNLIIIFSKRILLQSDWCYLFYFWLVYQCLKILLTKGTERVYFFSVIGTSSAAGSCSLNAGNCSHGAAKSNFLKQFFCSEKFCWRLIVFIWYLPKPILSNQDWFYFYMFIVHLLKSNPTVTIKNI